MTLLDPGRNNIISYHARTSFASIASDPVDFDFGDFPGYANFEKKCFEADLRKTFIRSISAARPDVLVFDFIDERYDICELNGRIFSYNPLAEGIPHIAPLYVESRRISKVSEEGMSLWRAGLERSTKTLREHLPDTIFILHDARLTSRLKFDDGRIEDGFDHLKNWIPVMNAMLQVMTDQFISVVNPEAVVKAPDSVNFANGSHPWGVQPFHYTVEYYQHVADAITSAVEGSHLPHR